MLNRIQLHYDKQTICRLASANRHLYTFLGPLRFRDVTIRLGFDFSFKSFDFSSKTWTARLPKWLKTSKPAQPGIKTSEVIPWPPMHNNFLNTLHALISDASMARNLRAIRTVTIEEGPFTGLTAMKCPCDNRLKNQWSLVKSILQHATNLRSFCYNCFLPFPIELLTFLETERPHARLEILKWYQSCGGPAINDPLQSALANSPSLNTVVFGDRQCFSSYYRQSFGRITREAPNLKVIRYGYRTGIDAPNSRNPCCARPYSSDPEPWSIRDDHSRNAVMQAFLNTTKPRIKAVEELKIVGHVLTTKALFPFNNFWQSFLDLSKLRVLDLTASSVQLEFEKLSNPNPFTSLKKLSFGYQIDTYDGNASRLQAAIYMFLESCSLEALAVFSSPRLDIERLLSAQTGTLSFLLIEWYPTATDLYFLRDQCESLEFLGINTRLPHEDATVCNVLVTFENLRCLRLWIDGLSWGYIRPRNVPDRPVSSGDWQEGRLANQSPLSSSEDIIIPLWNFIASKWCGKQLPKVAIRGSYDLRSRTNPHNYLGRCEAFWVVEPKGKACPGSRDADFYRGFDLVGFENYKVASFPDVELDYPRIPMPYTDRDNFEFVL